MNSTTLKAFESELEKISARAGLKLIRGLFSQGTPEALQRASALAKTPGVLKPGALGSQVAHLGAGAEGTADLVAHPEYGLSVRKLYDPTSAIASPALIGRKVQLAKALQSPHMADTYGFARTGRGGKATFHEYVPGGRPNAAEELDVKNRLRSAGAEKGYQLEDIRAANIRGGKAIDILPFYKGEAAGMGGAGGNLLMLTPRGQRRFFTHMRKSMGRAEEGLPREKLYGMLRGGATGKPLQAIPSAPAREAFSLPPSRPPVDLSSIGKAPSGAFRTANPGSPTMPIPKG
jgi:hypothetical protein